MHRQITVYYRIDKLLPNKAKHPVPRMYKSGLNVLPSTETLNEWGNYPTTGL